MYMYSNCDGGVGGWMDVCDVVIFVIVNDGVDREWVKKCFFFWNFNGYIILYTHVYLYYTQMHTYTCKCTCMVYLCCLELTHRD